MGNLSKWIEDKKTASINTEEYDITVNDTVRKLFFDQIEDLDFDYEVKEDDDIYISVRLTYPDAEFRPFKFLLDTKRLILTPQYTKTHRNFIAENGSIEYTTLKNLCTYIEDDYMRNKTKGFKRSAVSNIPVNTNKVLIARVTGEYIRGGVDFIFEECCPVEFDGSEKITIYYTKDTKVTPLFISKPLTSKDDISFDVIPPNDIGVRHMYTKTDGANIEIIIFADIFNTEGVQNFSAELVKLK